MIMHLCSLINLHYFLSTLTVMTSVWDGMRRRYSPLQMILRRTHTPHTHTPAQRGRSFLKVRPGGQRMHMQVPFIQSDCRTSPPCLFCLWMSCRRTRPWWSSRTEPFRWSPTTTWNTPPSKHVTPLIKHCVRLGVWLTGAFWWHHHVSKEYPTEQDLM